ncbi:hypothetical protein QYE76_020013 [Lolium multiflorum]|uniref:Uncharacterized protein n=1 Tax=Lolium multiflorum TaxID=4521 RepID=A0AAD8VQX8_LOLMU|nr:hypothetical protein QYE76_020013 [Lolium multiflorum]
MTSSDGKFSNDDFFPDVNNLFGNLNMGDDADPAVQGATAAASTVVSHVAPSVVTRNMNCYCATLVKAKGELSAAQEEAYMKVDALVNMIVDSYMTFDNGKEVGMRSRPIFGLTLSCMSWSNYYDYKLTGKHSIVKQAHEI